MKKGVFRVLLGIYDGAFLWKQLLVFIFANTFYEDVWQGLNPLSANPTKWSSTLNRRQNADELFEYVWPFGGVGA